MAQKTIVANGVNTNAERDADMNSNYTELYARTTGTGIVIDADKFFVDDAARDAYFTGAITTGQQVAVLVSGETYDVQQYDGIHWLTIATGVRVDNSVYPLLSFWELNEAGELEYKGIIRVDSIITAPGSVRISDSILSSGGRMISSRSESTGNLGAFIIQLFGDSQYSPATIYDPTQVGALFDVQVADEAVQSGVTETSIKQVIQNNVQLMKVRIKPFGGVVVNDFNFEVRMTVNGEPIYSQLVTPTDLTDVGGGVFELPLINPSQFDIGSDAFIKTSGINLLGGIGYDGSDTVRFGDPTKSDFFPWLQTFSIPIVRLAVATEEFATPVTLDADTTTQESLDLTGQEIKANKATQTSDGVMSKEDKTTHDNVVANGAGDAWMSGGLITENSPKDQKVLYGAVSYEINGILKTVTPAGTYDLENAFGAVNHYSGMVNDQHAYVNIYVDNDQVMKSERGVVAEKGDIAHPPLILSDSVRTYIIEIKVDKNNLPKDIGKKQIDDQRTLGTVNTDRTFSVSVDDETEGYGIDKISTNGSVTATIENPGGAEKLRFDYVGGALPTITYTNGAVHLDALDVSSIAPYGILYTNTGVNKEFKSLAGGVDQQIVKVVNLASSTWKVKDTAGTGQQIHTEGAGDKTFGGYGGFELIYVASTGMWYMLTAI